METAAQYLSSSYSATIHGFASRGPSQFILATIGVLPDGVYAVVAPDAFGLHAIWHIVGGTIMGASYSGAVFTYPIMTMTTVAASSCLAMPFPRFGRCFPGNSAAAFYTDGETAEWNNMPFAPNPTLACGPPNWCYLYAQSSVPYVPS